MDAVIGSQVMGSVDAEVASIDVESLSDGFEYFRVVDCALFHEIEKLVLSGDSFFSEVVKLDCQLVLKLSIFGEVISVISVVEVLSVFCERMEELVFCPCSDSVASHGGHFHFAELSSSQKV